MHYIPIFDVLENFLQGKLLRCTMSKRCGPKQTVFTQLEPQCIYTPALFISQLVHTGCDLHTHTPATFILSLLNFSFVVETACFKSA